MKNKRVKNIVIVVCVIFALIILNWLLVPVKALTPYEDFNNNNSIPPNEGNIVQKKTIPILFVIAIIIAIIEVKTTVKVIKEKNKKTYIKELVLLFILNCPLYVTIAFLLEIQETISVFANNLVFPETGMIIINTICKAGIIAGAIVIIQLLLLWIILRKEKNNEK